MKSKIQWRKFLLLILPLLFSIVLYLVSGQEGLFLNGNQIPLLEKKQGSSSYQVDAYIDDYKIDNLEVNVEGHAYSQSECEKLFLECKDDLLSEFLNDNASMNKIMKPVNLISSIDNYPFLIEWFISHPNILTYDGTIVCNEETTIQVIAKLSYEQFEQQYILPITVIPSEDSIKAFFRSQIEEEIGGLSANDSGYLELPSNILGHSIIYREHKSSKAFYLLIGPIISILLFWGNRRDQSKRALVIEQQIMNEYPGMVQKLTLYLAAGLSVRNAWERILSDVQEQGKGDSPLYQQMKRTLKEIQNGVTENLAYSQFGDRVGLVPIIRFTTLITQNLKKGSFQLCSLLSDELQDVFEMKKNSIKVRGEETGTKLLIPMMILLIVIMLIIMIPSFWNM